MRNSSEFAEHLKRLQRLVIKAGPQLYQVIDNQNLDMPISEDPLPLLPNPELSPKLTPPSLN